MIVSDSPTSKSNILQQLFCGTKILLIFFQYFRFSYFSGKISEVKPQNFLTRKFTLLDGKYAADFWLRAY